MISLKRGSKKVLKVGAGGTAIPVFFPLGLGMRDHIKRKNFADVV
jgi:hypothetical protein